MSYNEEEIKWFKNEIERLSKEYGEVPPLYRVFPQVHPYSIHWRMGSGEDYVIMFGYWWNNQSFDEAQRIDYFRRWPPPPRWLEWIIDEIWDVTSGVNENEINFEPYFTRIEELGFGSKDEYEKDLADPKWLENGI